MVLAGSVQRNGVRRAGREHCAIRPGEQPAAEHTDVFVGESQRLPHHVRKILLVPVGFHDATIGMPASAFENRSDFVDQDVGQHASRQLAAAVLGDSIVQQANPGALARHGIREGAGRDRIRSLVGEAFPLPSLRLPSIAAKRGGATPRVNLDEIQEIWSGRERELIALNDALNALKEFDPRKASVIEIRFSED